MHHGRVVKRTGDGILIEFRSVVDAVRCALEVQNGLAERNEGLPPERRIEFRIGVHLGDVVEEADCDLMGDGVNIAARLERIAEPGGICLSNAAYEQVRDKVKEQYAAITFGSSAFSRAKFSFQRAIIRSATSSVCVTFTSGHAGLGHCGMAREWKPEVRPSRFDPDQCARGAICDVVLVRSEHQEKPTAPDRF